MKLDSTVDNLHDLKRLWQNVKRTSAQKFCSHAQIPYFCLYRSIFLPEFLNTWIRQIQMFTICSFASISLLRKRFSSPKRAGIILSEKTKSRKSALPLRLLWRVAYHTTNPHVAHVDQHHMCLTKTFQSNTYCMKACQQVNQQLFDYLIFFISQSRLSTDQQISIFLLVFFFSTFYISLTK